MERDYPDFHENMGVDSREPFLSEEAEILAEMEAQDNDVTPDEPKTYDVDESTLPF